MQKSKFRSILNPQVSLGFQFLAGIAATVAAVALPQLCHMAGAALGAGSSIGEVLLPMHLPVMLVGLLAGPYAGAAAGILSPIISFYLTAMPKPAMLPFMIIELFIYGLCAGLLKNSNMNSLLKVFITQLAGRAIRAVAILIGVKLAGSVIPLSIIYTSIYIGLPGIALQLILIPCILSGVKKLQKYEK